MKRNANRFRPLLERCEERDVPAASGTAFYDLNGNGTQDSGELGAANLTVWLYHGGGSSDVVTDSNGNWSLPLVGAPGDSVSVTPPPSQFTYANTTATVGGSGTANIGLVGYGADPGGRGTISGRLYYDADGDGYMDAGETGGPEMVMLTLYHRGSVVGSTINTTTNGYYEFSGLWPTDSTNKYSIQIGMLPAGSTITTPLSGGAVVAEVSGTGTSTVNVGVALPTVTISQAADGKEGGAFGEFRLTRTGDLSQEVTLNLNPPPAARRTTAATTP